MSCKQRLLGRDGTVELRYKYSSLAQGQLLFAIKGTDFTPEAQKAQNTRTERKKKRVGATFSETHSAG